MFEHGFPEHWSTLRKLVWLVGTGIIGGASYIWKTVTGTLLHITDALPSPMQKCEVTLEPIQAGSGDPSPTNVRPITGWTGCEVTRTGKNLINQETAEIFYRYFAGDGEQGFNWKYSQDSRSFAFPCIPNQIYTVSTTDPNLTIFRVGYIKDELPQSTSVSPIIYDVTRKSSDGSITLNPSSDATYIVIQLGQSRIRSANLQIEFGSTATDYEPYQGTTIDIDWTDEAGTVYVCKYDLVSGKMTVDRASVDLGTQSWTYRSTAGSETFYATLSGCDFGVENQSVCSAYVFRRYITGLGQLSSLINGEYAFFKNGDVVYFRNTNYTTADAFKASVTGQTFVYPLATPIEIQLTPQEISTLAGENNVWSDANGDITLIYKAQAE